MTSATTHLDEPALGVVGARRTTAIAAVLAAMTIAVLDAGMANMALPSIGRALDIAPANAIFVITAYQAGLITALLPLGALGERFGHRPVFTASVAVFAVASACSATSQCLSWLIVARFVQGLGGAGIMALGVALLRFSVPEARLGAAIGWNAMTVALASAAAPSVGAIVLSLGEWRWLFAVNLPIAALTLAATRALPASPRTTAALDGVSMGLNAMMFAALILAAQTATTSPRQAVALLGLAGLACVILVRREAPKRAPFLPLDLLRGESFRLSVIASVCCFTAQAAGLMALPFLLQHELRLPTLTAGLYLTAWPLSVAVAASVAGRLADRIPTAWLCGLGGAALAVGLAGCGFWATATQPLTLLPFISIGGLGFGLFQSPNNRNMFLSAPAERSGAAGGMQGTARVSGQTLGALLMTSLFSVMALGTALPASFAIAAALALTAGAVSLLRILT